MLALPRESSFRVPKISAKFHRDHPQLGHQMQVGWVKIGDFRQIAFYISKTVQEREREREYLFASQYNTNVQK